MNERMYGLSELWIVNYELHVYKNIKQTRDSEYLHGDLRTVNFHTLIKWWMNEWKKIKENEWKNEQKNEWKNEWMNK